MRHNGQLKPSLRCKGKRTKWMEGLLDIVALEVMAESVKAGTQSKSWRERVPDCGNGDAEMMKTFFQCQLHI